MTMLTVTRAITPDDVAYVEANPWARTADEARAIGMPSSALRRMIEQGNAESGAIKADGLPVALLGVRRDREGRYNTWFVASALFEQHGLATTKLLRNVVDDFVARVRPRALYSISLAGHPKAQRWFRLLGFTRDPVYERTGIAGERFMRFIFIGGIHVPS